MSNDFDFDFSVEDAVPASTGGSQSDVDWGALNDHVIERAKTASKKRSIKGIISGIVDLGVQEQADYQEDYKDTDEQNKRIADGFAFLQQEGGKTIFCSPQKPVMQVAVTVDFPAIKVNKGQFFGDNTEGEDLPLRMLMNGEFFMKDVGRVVGRGYSVREKKHEDGTWAFAKNNQLHKLAAACDILDEKGYFHKEDLGKLIGKGAQFEIRLWMKPSKKDASKSYFTEDIALAGMIPEDDDGNIVIPKLDPALLHMVNFNPKAQAAIDKQADWVKTLRASIKNTMKQATNYKDSVVQTQIEANSNSGNTGSGNAAAKPKEEPKQEPVQSQAPDLDFDDDIPF